MVAELTTKMQQTEVGEIPEDWNVVRLADVGESIIGLTYSPRNVKPHGTLVLRSSNVQNGKLAYEDNVYVEMDLPDRVIVKEGDILICVRNGSRQLIGKCALIDKSAEGHAFGAFMSIYRSEFGEFIFHQFQSGIVQRQINETLGATINQLTNRDLAGFQIPLPPTPEERQAIATALNDCDQLITALEALIAKKEAIRQGAMQELLTPKDGWIDSTLGTVADVVGGGTPSSFKPEYWNGDINWFTPTEIGENKYSSQSIRRITKAGLENSSAKLLPKGSILLTSRASIGDVSILQEQAATNQGFQSLVVKDGNSNEFVYYLLLTIKDELVQNASGSTFLEISPSKVKAISIKIPTPDEQVRIAKILSDMDVEIATLNNRLAKTRLIKTGIMQQLLTGKKRLL